MVIKEWHRFVKTKNTKILDNLLSDEIVFYSPAVHTPIPGIESTKRYLTSAIEILFQGNCKYVREIKGNNIASCEFEGFLNDIYLNGTDIIQWNSSKKISENFDFKSSVDIHNVLDTYRNDFEKVKLLRIVLDPNRLLQIPAYWFYSIKICIIKA